MKTFTLRLTSRVFMIVAVVVLATGAVFAGVSTFISSFDTSGDA